MNVNIIRNIREFEHVASESGSVHVCRVVVVVAVLFLRHLLFQ